MLLTLKNISKQYFVQKSVLSNNVSIIDALCNINFSLKESSVLGVLGETGSGKTTLGKLIVGLIKPSNGNIIYGFPSMRKNVQIIFQNPFSSLNPRMKVGNILREPLFIHKLADKNNINHKLDSLLRKTQLDNDCLNRYPGEFSGGQRQRIAIARAISIEPKILICDEPTASLDLSVQAQILNLFIQLKEEFKLSYVFISHNIEVISFIADEVLVLYEGAAVERGLKSKIFTNPMHPYTKILLGKKDKIDKIENLKNIGCKFYNNCSKKSKTCKHINPIETEIEENHYVCCHNIK